VEQFISALQRFGIGRLAAIIGVSAGVAAALFALILNFGSPPQSLLYSNLDLKEASTITAALDQAGIKYDAKGDGSTIFVARDKVGSTRMLLAGKGLPSTGSVGYEIFDQTNALGQTDFVQNLNRQRALEGELARTIRSQEWVNFSRVQLSMPKRELFEDAPQPPTAAVTIGVNGRAPTAEQVRSLQNLVASAVPGLMPEKVTIVDQKGKLLAGGQSDSLGAAGEERRNEAEEAIRRKVRDLVEGVVGPGKVRVNVTAVLDLARVTVQESKYDPDGQVVRSTQTVDENAKENKPDNTGQATVANNIPGGTGAATPADPTLNASGRTEETTNFEISSTNTTTITEPGQVKKLSVAVAVDGLTSVGKDGKPTPYKPRTAEEMKRIEDLVRSAVGFDQARGDTVTVTNVQFARDDGLVGGVVAGSPLAGFDKNDIMRAAELGILTIVALLVIFFVVRPLLATARGEGSTRMALVGQAGAGQLALANPDGSLPALSDGGIDARIDIARIEGQVKSSSVKSVSEFENNNPEESISIIRGWLHEAT
jgi:flagellar M-ring protein FliF